MSNPRRGGGRSNYHHTRSRGGDRFGNHSGGGPSFNEQKSEEDQPRGSFFPDNRGASGIQSPSGSDRRSKQFGSDKKAEYRSKPDQGPGNSSREGRGKARSFKMDTDGNLDQESKPQVSANDEMKERIKNDISLRRSMKSTESSPVEANSEINNSSHSSPASSVKTGSGVFKCSNDLSSSNQSCSSGLSNSKNCDKREEEQTKGTISSRKSCVIEIDGDVFTAPDDVSLAHCVGADLRMGKGIAVQFWEKFKSVGCLFDQQVGPGGVAFIKNDQRYVFYLITKQASDDKPTKETMRMSLVELHQKCTKFRVTKLAMPKIGCGLDALEWKDVKKMLDEIFTDDFVITIYNLDKEFINSPKSGFKTVVENHDLMLKDIEEGTGLLYIASAQQFITEEMKSIDEKYPFIEQLFKKHRQLGIAYWTPVSKYDKVYGLVSKQSRDSSLSYEALESALLKLKEFNQKHRYEYFGIQAFVEKNDPHVMDKIETLLRNSLLPGVTFWICWPPSLVHKRPSSSKPNAPSMHVQESQYSGTAAQYSNFTTYPSKFAEQFKESMDNEPPIKVESESDNRQRNSLSRDQNVGEVAEKMYAQSLADKSKPESVDPNYSVATNDASMEWIDSSLAQMPEHVDTPNMEEDDGWPDEHGRYVEDERRRTDEKKLANQLNKEKARQERNSPKPKSCVTECKGDLFEAVDTLCLVHCVAEDFRMGSGIAILFRQKFGSIPELFNQKVNQGGVAYIHHEKRYIFYLVTKRESTGKPTYGTLERSLHELHKKCKDLNVTELGMPRIGCGLDRLDWNKVKGMLEKIFADGFSIKVYNLEKEYKETKKSMPITTIRHEAIQLKDIQQGTGLIYIGNMDQVVTNEMKSLDSKYPFLQRLAKTAPKLGTVVRTEASYPREIVYGLICRRSPRDRIDFVQMKAALRQLANSHKNDRYEYFAIEAIEEIGDDNIMAKIETMLRYSKLKAEVWICFPPALVRFMPSTNSPSYYANITSGGEGNRGEMDSQRMFSILRDMQRTKEAMYRKLLILDDLKEERLDVDSFKSMVSHGINELRGKMEELSAKNENLTQEIRSFHESHEDFRARVSVLEAAQNDLKERFESLERRLFPLGSSTENHGYINNCGYQATVPVYPGPRDYYSERMYHPVYHPGYLNSPQIFSDQLPGEKEALSRAAEESAMRNNLDIWRGKGGISMRKNADERWMRINTRADLDKLENSLT